MEGLRGLAILLVFTCHYYDIIWSGMPGQGKLLQDLGSVLLMAGGTGVDLFFVLSGFLIYGAVSRPHFRFRKFLSRRAQRIYPTFLCVFSFYLAISPFLFHVHSSSERYSNRIPAGFPDNVVYLLANLTFLPGVFAIPPLMNVAWSLSYEVLFYICLPILVLVTRLQGRTKALRISIILSTAIVFWGANMLLPMLFYVPSNPAHPTHIRSLMFLGGMLVYELLQTDGAAWWIGNPFRSGALAAVVTMVLIALVTWNSSNSAGSNLVRQEAMVAALLFAGYSFLVLITLTKETRLFRVFSNAPLRYLGNISYSFYLVHGIPLHAFAIIVSRLRVTQLPQPFVWLIFLTAYPFVFAATAAISGALFLAVEKRFSLAPRGMKAFARTDVGRSAPSQQIKQNYTFLSTPDK